MGFIGLIDRYCTLLIFLSRQPRDLPRLETEHQLLENRASESVRENAIMAEIGRIINSSLDIEDPEEPADFD